MRHTTVSDNWLCLEFDPLPLFYRFRTNPTASIGLDGYFDKALTFLIPDNLHNALSVNLPSTTSMNPVM